ncbi:MAG: SUMF1/EgtB/PvdO family nonheme iron enzyme [Thiocapsa sp.]|nr:SUMF1/EgtB/PvdO family nonheme iron enzyme [Thiocapsa sp.]MCG6985639.1 SUMF1/EgtB/PvdO family nonheme iron enzyme [Thiocapsa sp.]
MRYSSLLLLAMTALLSGTAAAADDAAVVRIFTIPGDAQVFVDGERKGSSPASAEETFLIRLPPGEYRIGARKNGFDPAERELFVAAGTEQTVKLSLAPEIVMVPIPGGCFVMGSPAEEPERDPDEGPQHEVCVPPFQLGQREVTFADWDACVMDQGCTKNPSDEGWGRGQRPVINISWEDVNEYLRWLNRLTGMGYRLPTEAEWEYAARAGTTTPFSTGSCIDTDQANYDGTFEYAGCGAHTGVNLGRTAPTGSYPANPWGLFDMHGNVNELTLDCWNGGFDGAPTDGSAWLDGNCTQRVMRSGSWYGYAGYMRSAYRCRAGTGFSHRSIGFRLARTPES